MSAPTREDVKNALDILRRWESRAHLKGKTEAERDCKEIQRVIKGLIGEKER